MPNPTPKSVHVNRPLSNLSTAYKNERSDFIADQVFPIVPVAKQGDLFYRYTKDYWFRTIAEKRANATESAGGGFKVDTDSYFAHVWAVHKDVSDRERANADAALDPDSDSTDWVTEQLLLRREKEWHDTYFQTGVWGSDFTPATLWDAGGSDPITDVRAQTRAIKRLTGRKPNTLVVSGSVDDALNDNAAVLARINGGARPGDPALVTPALLASAFGVSRYLVAEAIENTATEGAAFAGADLFGKHALLVYSEPSPGLKKPSGGYTFSWTGLLGGRAGSAEMSRFRMEKLKADRIEGEAAYDMKLVGADLGIFFDSVIS